MIEIKRPWRDDLVTSSRSLALINAFAELMGFGRGCRIISCHGWASQGGSLRRWMRTHLLLRPRLLPLLCLLRLGLEEEAATRGTWIPLPATPAPQQQISTQRPSLRKPKRPRRGNVTFDQVTVFFFPRCQGFTSVRSRGGCTLGMMQRHSTLRTYTLAEFAVEQRLLRREKLLNRLREEKLEALKLKLTKNGTQESEEAERLTVDDIPEQDIDIIGANLDEGSFLQPYPSKRRYALLKAAGVKKIDKEEKRQLHELRISREDCGCDCQGFCEPETCSCSLAGIKCQMDHSSFPCGCTKDGCGNTEGRIEFNSTRVQTHYIHTIMKLELEKRLEEQSSTEEEEEKTTTGTASVPAAPSFPFS
ncbi:cysteine/serine-rich nuclear protein 1-like protein [Lates japonicus]|uniref:Cysteine/serine-rich nuclear protein 1-like protein n=1 Tax=Lates japonicus TaxID=270547 RepID=A0AAD3MIA3_LATJO|nr:cysteine/serine-rich nuclear protein 1-like protein [Lates japonicus]